MDNPEFDTLGMFELLTTFLGAVLFFITEEYKALVVACTALLLIGSVWLKVTKHLRKKSEYIEFINKRNRSLSHELELSKIHSEHLANIHRDTNRFVEALKSHHNKIDTLLMAFIQDLNLNQDKDIEEITGELFINRSIANQEFILLNNREEDFHERNY